MNDRTEFIYITAPVRALNADGSEFRPRTSPARMSAPTPSTTTTFPARPAGAPLPPRRAELTFAARSETELLTLTGFVVPEGHAVDPDRLVLLAQIQTAQRLGNLTFEAACALFDDSHQGSACR